MNHHFEQMPIPRGKVFLRSMPMALLIPLGAWAVIGIIRLDEIMLFVGMIALVVHFIAYLVVGGLIFAVLPDEYSVVWEPEVGCFLGAFLGGMTLCLPAFLDGSFRSNPQGVVVVFLVGAFYGVVTASVAIYERRTFLN